MAQTWIFLLENLLLLLPLLHTCLSILHLSTTLPLLPEEQPCLTTCYILLASPLLIALLSVAQYHIFVAYNTRGHPWSLLLTSRRQLRLRLVVAARVEWSTSEVEDSLVKLWEELVLRVRVSRPHDGQELLAEVATSPEFGYSDLERALTGGQVGWLESIELLREELISGGPKLGGQPARRCCCSWAPQV